MPTSSPADGAAWASMASPDQGQYDIPLKSVKEDGANVDLVLGFGTLAMTWEGDHFKGTWKQGGAEFPLTLRQVAEFPRKARPQTPQAPFPYRDETPAIPGGDGVMLGATLSLPAKAKRPPAVVLVHGSGPSTRDADIAEHQHFRVLADYLARHGIAVLRYDKRGNGRSSGDFNTLTRDKLADDAHAAVRALRARGQFSKVGLIGLSEGSSLSATVAARAPREVGFVVSMAGVGLPGLQNMLLQDRIESRDAGATPEEAERASSPMPPATTASSSTKPMPMRAWRS
ncbi:S9 family peptidase [Massilia sp. Se16.2.3]|uniref:alpha/beta hydrolase family protein n=1 Tax=Massilia sp. Se16.2.3 TaxID=2709303 RepID=UPI00160419C9|nr:alpha/beta fold hydrolase [Massilia sp. Se16.2.3]QNA99705.1 alpha/beta hydrolase [Massilia sp. Se16.2.3]